MEICRGKERIKLNEKVTTIDFDESNRPFSVPRCINKSTTVSRTRSGTRFGKYSKIDRCGNRGIFTRLSVEAFAEKDIDIGTKQGLVVILRSIPIWMGITISQSIINERRRCWIP